MGLDFSKLENIAYRGYEGAEARAAKDSLIERGFTIIEGEKTPFEADEKQASEASTPPAGSPLKRNLAPFTGMDKSRNYRAYYRAACDFHERHNPPRLDAEYWDEAAEDMSQVANAFDNDPFLIGLLVEIYTELEREYKILKEDAFKPL